MKIKHRNVGSEPAEKETVGLRIIGGTFRGRKLQYIGDNRVRPMKDRTREAVFNLLGPAVKGKHVIDVFSGTGAIAIEAMSRGAASATLIEIHRPTAVLLRKNLESLNLLERCELLVTDAFYWGKTMNERTCFDLPTLMFFCPPYSFYVDRRDEMVELIGSLHAQVPAGSLFVAEMDNRFDISLLERPSVNHWRQRSYPPAEIAVWEK